MYEVWLRLRLTWSLFGQCKFLDVVMHSEYSVITPFLSAGSGGDQVMFISLWVKLDTCISAGGPDGAKMKHWLYSNGRCQ